MEPTVGSLTPRRLSMTITNPFVLPTEDGGAIELDAAAYRQLLASKASTFHQGATNVAAAQALRVLTGEWTTFREIVREIYGVSDTKEKPALRRGLHALVEAGLIEMQGGTIMRRYRLATPGVPADPKGEAGFSLIDVVVTVAIIVALSVGSFVGYSGLVSQAKQGAVTYAASNVWDAVNAYEQDGDPATTACSAIDEYNASSERIKVTLTVPSPGNPNAPGLVYVGQGGANTYSC
jgi:type II secretory pathway pseudopilin PulG